MKKILFFSAFLALFVISIKPPIDPDLFWHLRYGEEILKTRSFPFGDQFSFTFTGYPWADSYWLSEVLFFYLVSKTGFFLPVALFAVLGAASFFAVGFWGRVKKANIWVLSAAVFFGAVVAWPILGFRPQTISLALFGLVFILLNQFWLTKKSPLIFFLPPVFLLGANLHAGFTLGLILIWLFWGFETGRFLVQRYLKIKKIQSPSLTLGQIKFLGGINLLSTLVTLINPYGTGLWQTILTDASSAKIKNQIVEWASPNFHSELGLLFLFLLLTMAILVYLGRMRVHPTRFLILLVFCFMALAAVRHISFFALLATPFLAEELAVLPWGKINFPLKKLALILFFLVFAVGWAIQVFPQTYQSTRSVKDLALAGNYPYQAVEYLKKHPPQRMFNNYNWGGFLIWQLPQSRTFIDGRMPGWKKDGREIMVDYDKITEVSEEMSEVLDFWRIEVFLIPPDFPLAQYLKIHPDWEEKHRDKTAVIFTRR